MFIVHVIPYNGEPYKVGPFATPESARKAAGEEEGKHEHLGDNRPFVDVHLETCPNMVECVSGCGKVYP